MLDAALEQAPARLRRYFDGVSYLDPRDADYPLIRDAMTTALAQIMGSAAAAEARSAEILAPS